MSEFLIKFLSLCVLVSNVSLAALKCVHSPLLPPPKHLEKSWLPSTTVKPTFCPLDKKWNLKLTHCWQKHLEKIKRYLISRQRQNWTFVNFVFHLLLLWGTWVPCCNTFWLEGTGTAAGFLLTPAEGFGLWPRLLLPSGEKKLFILF